MRGSTMGGHTRWGIGLGASAVVGVLLILTSSPATGAVVSSPGLTTAKASCFVGSGPLYPGYDPVTNDIYVPNSASHNMTVLSESCKAVQTFTLKSSASPYAAAFDPSNNLVYVTDSNLNEIYEISGTKIATASCTCLDGPEAITYDPSLLYMVVTNYVSGTIASITGTLFGPTEPVGKQPDAIVFNAYTKGIVVAISGSNNLTAFDASTLLLQGSIPVGKDPSGLAHDPENAYTYVANTGSNNVTILDGAILIGSIRGFDRPSGVSWDQAALEIYVSNVGNGKVYAVNATGDIEKKFATASGSDPYGLVYDSSNHDVYAVGLVTDKVYILT